MNRKERIAALLSQMDNETLEQLESALAPDENNSPAPAGKKNNRKRGRGKKRQKYEEIHSIKETDEEKPTNNKSQKRKSRKRKSQGGPSKGKQCRTTQMDTESRRVNRFDEFIKGTSLDPSEQEEMKIAQNTDKKRKNHKPFRTSRTNPIIEVRCRGCKEYFDVAASLVTDHKRYKCNDCSGSACG